MADLTIPAFTGLRNAAAVAKVKAAVAWKEGQAEDAAGFKAALATYFGRCLEDYNTHSTLAAGDDPIPTTSDFGSEIGE